MVERDNLCFGACGSQPYPCSYLSWIPRIDRERRHAWSHDFLRENQRYIEKYVYKSNARLWAGGKVVIFHWSKCWRRVNNRCKMNPLDTGYEPSSVTRRTDIVSILLHRAVLLDKINIYMRQAIRCVYRESIYAYITRCPRIVASSLTEIFCERDWQFFLPAISFCLGNIRWKQDSSNPHQFTNV